MQKKYNMGFITMRPWRSMGAGGRLIDNSCFLFIIYIQFLFNGFVIKVDFKELLIITTTSETDWS